MGRSPEKERYGPCDSAAVNALDQASNPARVWATNFGLAATSPSRAAELATRSSNAFAFADASPVRASAVGVPSGQQLVYRLRMAGHGRRQGRRIGQRRHDGRGRLGQLAGHRAEPVDVGDHAGELGQHLVQVGGDLVDRAVPSAGALVLQRGGDRGERLVDAAGGRALSRLSRSVASPCRVVVVERGTDPIVSARQEMACGRARRAAPG